MSDNPTIGFVSLGCPKALVDSERILTRLQVEGYQTVAAFDDADLVVINTCGFIDEAVEESFDSIGEALAENGRVIVTGCLGAQPERIREIFPDVLAITGPHDYESVMRVIHQHLPPKHDPFLDLVPAQGVKLTPRHYAYLKISEGCNHRCSFCIIPSMRGDLASRPVREVLSEAESLVQAGVKELLVVSQDTSAYGVDLKYRPDFWRAGVYKSNLFDLCRGLGELGVWVRLHYVYPYPHVDQVVPLMADGQVLPYLDIPFQHAAPRVLKAMRRPASAVNTLERIEQWRSVCPDITIRSTFIVGFPGETDDEFDALLDWLRLAQLDRVGCFQYSPVEGAAANELAKPVSDVVKQERWDRFMETAAEISTNRLRAKVGSRIDVLVDEIENGVLTARSKADAPEIDGNVIIEIDEHAHQPLPMPGDLLTVEIINSDEYDLYAHMDDRRY
jgi:ribosomal protein S12 methylthiotransferase